MRQPLLIFSLALCMPASAQTVPAPSADAVLEAMSKSGGTAARMASYLAANGVAVEFHDSVSDARARRTWKPGERAGESVRVVRVNPRYAATGESQALPASVLAYEAAELMYAHMPESAEKRYIAVAAAAQSFFELGGDVSAVSDSDPEWARSLSFWKEHGPKSGVKALRKDGAKSLGDLRLSAEEGLDGLRRANAESALYGALSGSRGRLGWGIRSGYLGQMIEGSKSRLKTIRAAEEDFKEFKKYDKARRRALGL